MATYDPVPPGCHSSGGHSDVRSTGMDLPTEAMNFLRHT